MIYPRVSIISSIDIGSARASSLEIWGKGSRLFAQIERGWTPQDRDNRTGPYTWEEISVSLLPWFVLVPDRLLEGYQLIFR